MKQGFSSVTIYQETKYECVIKVPDYLKNWDGFSSWELIRYESMKQNLSSSSIILDIGVETGWQSVLIAGLVGPSNIILVEPSIRFWGNIMHTWNHNFGTPPRATIQALVSNKRNDIPFQIIKEDFVVKSDLITETMDYVNIFHENRVTPEIRIDDLKLEFNAINIDCEGAEYLIIEGAKETLRNSSLKVWISLHPDLSLKHYGVDVKEVVSLMTELGYKNKLLGVDHEEHWFFYK